MKKEWGFLFPLVAAPRRLMTRMAAEQEHVCGSPGPTHNSTMAFKTDANISPVQCLYWLREKRAVYAIHKDRIISFTRGIVIAAIHD